jgi:two-component system, NarL family, nitrate/nitrite response regulator NarL
MTRPRLRVTVVDDHTLFAEALVIAMRAREIEAQTVIADSTSTTYAQLGRAIVKTRPHLVLLDLDLGIPGDRLRLVSGLASGGFPVVIVTGSADRRSQGEALAHGACAVIEKSVPFSQIVEAITRARNGLSVMSRAQREVLLSVYHDSEEARRGLYAKFSLMTRRETEVLGQLMVGRQVSEIARNGFVSESTVRTQVKAILAKLQVSSQLTAVAMAHQVGWRPPSDDGQAPAEPLARPLHAVPRDTTPRPMSSTA